MFVWKSPRSFPLAHLVMLVGHTIMIVIKSHCVEYAFAVLIRRGDKIKRDCQRSCARSNKQVISSYFKPHQMLFSPAHPVKVILAYHASSNSDAHMTSGDISIQFFALCRLKLHQRGTKPEHWHLFGRIRHYAQTFPSNILFSNSATQPIDPTKLQVPIG